MARRYIPAGPNVVVPILTLCTRGWPSDERDAKPVLHTPPPRARACDLPSFAPHSPVFLTSHVLHAPLPPPTPYASPLCPSLPCIRSHTPHIAASHTPLHLAIFPALHPSLATPRSAQNEQYLPPYALPVSTVTICKPFCGIGALRVPSSSAMVPQVTWEN
ncbi:hypothetical protein B0H14DRAFT_3435789 [Mycena olivaceomarginata]|nr:hypothetical protein B0H14DRAFT_3435789 [Mycena olivaceomarginata]